MICFDANAVAYMIKDNATNVYIALPLIKDSSTVSFTSSGVGMRSVIILIN
jgi:hypothetical protein